MWESIVVGLIVAAAAVGVVRSVMRSSKTRSGCGGCCGCQAHAGDVIVKIVTVMAVVASSASAEIVDGVNWADEVVEYTDNIQNYNGVLMNEDTEWWLLGTPDCDANGNGYAWDSVDQDTVAGWRTTNADEYVIVYWEHGLPDLPGDDLWIHMYGGPYAEAQISASADGIEFELIGTIDSGTPGYFRDEAFDFDGLLDGCVHYVKALRIASGPQTGMFFDAFGGGVLSGDLDGDCDVDLGDLAALLGVYGLCSDDPGYDPVADFDDSGCIDLGDLATLLGNYGTGT